ncbi:hypothetical protein PoB_001301900 [Plakobranchus ocellatus]|uniref:Uncharacterized protein n=1 Tax=Plakobranchus ocellatus TaxID=259542 RepID=A0AAV3YXR4_9GAST|nr:hypothetical protein PoB_001301900 [Plakobranchus ocellatus]
MSLPDIVLQAVGLDTRERTVGQSRKNLKQCRIMATFALKLRPVSTMATMAVKLYSVSDNGNSHDETVPDKGNSYGCNLTWYPIMITAMVKLHTLSDNGNSHGETSHRIG